MLYSDKPVETQEWRDVSRSSIQFWGLVVERSLSEGETLVSENGQFKAELEYENNVPYLKIQDRKTGQNFYHYSDSTPSQEKYSVAYMIEDVDMDTVDFHKLMRIVEIAGGELEALSNWESESLKVISEVEMLYRGLLQKWHQVNRENSLMSSEEFFKKFINTNQIYFAKEPFGTAELNAIDEVPFVRIVHRGTELSYLIIEDGTVDLKGEHFKQYIARQHIAAGTGRNDGEYGRDVIILHVPTFKEELKSDLLDPEKYTKMARHVRYSGAWWKDYWLSIKKYPTLSTASLGIASGLLQAGTTLVTAGVIAGVGLSAKALGVEYFSGLEFPYAVETAFTAFAYGSAFGMIASMFKNWERLPAPAWRKTLKVMSNSLVFYYLLSFVISGGDFQNFMVKFNPMTHDGLMRNLMIIGAAFLSNRSKPNWYNLATIREKIGLSRGQMEVNGFKLGWSKSVFEYQVAYLPNFFFRLIERLVNKGGNSLTFSGVGIMLLQIPFSEWVVSKFGDYYYKKTGHPAAKEMADESRRMLELKVRFFTDPKFTLEITKKYLDHKKESLVSVFKKETKSSQERGDRFIVPQASGALVCTPLFMGLR